MEEREIEAVSLIGQEAMFASEKFRFEASHFGILMYHGKSVTLFPWHRVYEVSYARA